jgi:hypothetical protein
MVLYAYDPSSKEAEAGRLQVQGHPGLHGETCLKKKKGDIDVSYYHRLPNSKSQLHSL